MPAVLAGIDARRLLERAEEMRDACRYGEGNPGLELGLALGEGWRQERDKVALTQVSGGFDLWVQQLLAESTGKQDKGLIPVEGDGPDVQTHEVRLESPYELGQEFFRWEFATAVAGSILGINPFDQPDVQAAKDKTNEVLERGGDVELEPQGSLDELLAGAAEGDYVVICAFVDPAREASSSRWSSACARPGARSCAASGRATCTRPGSCTRAARTRGSSSRSSTTSARSSRSPASRSASAG